jgi:hypothetical protein
MEKKITSGIKKVLAKKYKDKKPPTFRLISS